MLLARVPHFLENSDYRVEDVERPEHVPASGVTRPRGPGAERPSIGTTISSCLSKSLGAELILETVSVA